VAVSAQHLLHQCRWLFRDRCTCCFAERQPISAEVRLLLFTGLLGGFTTFSAFGIEGVNLIRRGEFAVAVSYALLSVVCGFAAVFVALKLFGTTRQTT
jgi:protein CrcB